MIYFTEKEENFLILSLSLFYHQFYTKSKLHDKAEIEQYSEKKVISLYEETPKQFLNPTQTPKMAH